MAERASTIAVILALALAWVAAPAGAAEGFGEALANGKASLGARYRLEAVDQDGFDKNALASTARVRLTWDSLEFQSFTLGIQADYTAMVGIEDFNSTTNGRTQYPVVADPEGLDLNQAFIRYRNADWTVTAGRQRILHGRQRFAGGVAWRQNEQTYDALRVQFNRGMLALDYSYVYNVNRIFGPGDGAQPGDWYGNSHYFLGTLTPAEGQEISGFGYLMDFQNDNGPANSNATIGAEYKGQFGQLTLNAAYARQWDWADNPVSYAASYYLAEGAYQLPSATLSLGYEVLGSDDGQAGIRMPSATLHKFQGWTDRFLATPARGVRDAYIRLTSQLGPTTAVLTYHDFNAVQGSGSYGTEVDASLVWKVRDKLSLQFKFARYFPDGFADDIVKGWFVVSYNM